MGSSTSTAEYLATPSPVSAYRGRLAADVGRALSFLLSSCFPYLSFVLFPRCTWRILSHTTRVGWYLIRWLTYSPKSIKMLCFSLHLHLIVYLFIQPPSCRTTVVNWPITPTNCASHILNYLHNLKCQCFPERPEEKLHTIYWLDVLHKLETNGTALRNPPPQFQYVWNASNNSLPSYSFDCRWWLLPNVKSWSPNMI